MVSFVSLVSMVVPIVSVTSACNTRNSEASCLDSIRILSTLTVVVTDVPGAEISVVPATPRMIPVNPMANGNRSSLKSTGGIVMSWVSNFRVREFAVRVHESEFAASLHESFHQ
jgi:hypothetical protein